MAPNHQTRSPQVGSPRMVMPTRYPNENSQIVPPPLFWNPQVGYPYYRSAPPVAISGAIAPQTTAVNMARPAPYRNNTPARMAPITSARGFPAGSMSTARPVAPPRAMPPPRAVTEMAGPPRPLYSGNTPQGRHGLVDYRQTAAVYGPVQFPPHANVPPPATNQVAGLHPNARSENQKQVPIRRNGISKVTKTRATERSPRNGPQEAISNIPDNPTGSKVVHPGLGIYWMLFYDKDAKETGRTQDDNYWITKSVHFNSRFGESITPLTLRSLTELFQWDNPLDGALKCTMSSVSDVDSRLNIAASTDTVDGFDIDDWLNIPPSGMIESSCGGIYKGDDVPVLRKGGGCEG